jgi:NAD(P)-dependent dehydrogenase (short-subunit alcohol dehydrogenase family)
MMPAMVEKEISAVLRDREIRKNLKGFREKGARVIYHSADVRDEVAMEEIIRSVYHEHGRIDAVIHGAGIIEDKLLIDKTADSFDRVFDTKADSTYLLSRYLQPDSLKCLVFFASLAGRAGNRGQCDYAAANELVNRFAWWLHHRWVHVRISAINWGPWETGMASAEVNRQFRERGVIPISRREGRAFFKREVLFAPPDEVEIVAGSFQSLEEKKPLSTRWPLVHRRDVQRDCGKASLQCALCSKNYPFLDDHRIDGKVVVPWAVAVELMAQTVQTVWPQWHIRETQNPQQLRGMIIEEESTLLVQVTVTHQEETQAHLAKAVISSSGRTGLPYYSASFLLAGGPVAPAPCPSLTAATPAELANKVFYREHLFHGCSFRLLRLVTGLDKSGVDATIIPSAKGLPWLANCWIFHPGVLDTVMQIGSFWTQTILNSFALPVRADRIARYGAYRIDSEELRVLIRVQSSTPQTMAFSFFVVDKSDRLLFRAENVEMSHSKPLLRLASQGPPV